MTAAKSEDVSPTAFATGYFWWRNGLSHPGLVTPRGRRLGRAFGVLMGGIRLVTGVSLDALMLARHRGIDALLTRAIEEGRVTQIVEIAAGMSARGWRFAQKYGDRITYIETDLPHMVEIKTSLLRNAGLTSPQHAVVALDALADSGPASLATVVGALNLNAGTAIITEGLLSYLETPTATALWGRIARVLSRFPHGLYLSDFYLMRENQGGSGTVFRSTIQRFVRGKMYVHFEALEPALAAFKAAGFRRVTLHETKAIPEISDIAGTKGANRVRVLEATT